MDSRVIVIPRDWYLMLFDKSLHFARTNPCVERHINSTLTYIHDMGVVNCVADDSLCTLRRFSNYCDKTVLLF